MRRGKINTKEQYIQARIEFLKDELKVTHDWRDQMWYRKLIQELEWILLVDANKAEKEIEEIAKKIKKNVI